jgi:hypothetical protein
MIINGNAQSIPLADCSVDTVVTDPPYELGFMGKRWDASGVAFDPATWAEALRVAKPGAFLLAFGGTRTWHRLACAIEDAGWILRDTLMYMYGAGFPKNHSFGCTCGGNAVEYTHGKQNTEHGMSGVREADLQAAEHNEPQQDDRVLSRVLKQAQDPRVSLHSGGDCEARGEDERGAESGMEGRIVRGAGQGLSNDQDAGAPPRQGKRLRAGAHLGGRKDAGETTGAGRGSAPQGPRQAEQQPGQLGDLDGSQIPLGETPPGGRARCAACGKVVGFGGHGSALKPSWEPIIVAMKPLDGTFAHNAERHGVAGLWIDGARIGTSDKREYPNGPGGKSHHYSSGKRSAEVRPDPWSMSPAGRWPPNCILDEHAAGLLDEQTVDSRSARSSSGGGRSTGERGGKGGIWGSVPIGHDGSAGQYHDSGGASRFFYVAKPSRAERDAGCYALEPRSGGDITGRKAGSAGAKASAYAGTTEAVRRNPHPTVKPVALMRYLVRLTRTPTGGTVLDPFCGSGTTGMACVCEDRDFIGVDLNPDYCELARARIAHVQKHGTDWKADPRQVAMDGQMDLLK